MPTPAKSRRRIVRGLVILASLLAFVSVIGIWLERQALDTDDWVTTSDQFLQNGTIRQTVADYLVDQLYANVSVKREIATALPDQVHGLAGPASAGLRQVAGDGANEVLKSSTAQQIWSEANRNAHEQLLVVLNGGNQVVSSRGGTVTLNLGRLVSSFISQLGIGTDVRLPATVGRITVLHSDQLETAQRIANSIKGITLILVLLTFGVVALAIYLSRPDDRWMTLLHCGIGLVAAGFAVIVARHVAGQIIVSDLVTDDSVKPAGDAAWSIATSLMVSIAITVIVLGTLFGAAGWLGSPNPSARATRQFMAPALTRHVGYFYGGVGFLLGTYFLTAPTHGMRAFLTTLSLGGLAAVGIHHLRRQTTREFPGAQSTAHPVARAGRRMLQAGRSLGAGASQIRVGELARGDRRSDQETRIDQLERLAALHEKGVLSSEELAAEKARVLGKRSE